MKKVFVYADWYMYEMPKLIGQLSFSSLRGKTLYSFEYNKEWLKTGISIDPELPLFAGMHYAILVATVRQNRQQAKDSLRIGYDTVAKKRWRRCR